MNPDLLTTRLLRLVHRTRSSARLIFGRATGLNELEWSIVLETGRCGALLVSEIANIVDADLAQISRAVGKLTDDGFIARQGSRTPARPTAEGMAQFQKLVRIGRARNRMLLANLPDGDIHFLIDAIDRLVRQVDIVAREEGVLLWEGDAPHGNAAAHEPQRMPLTDARGHPLMMPRLQLLFRAARRAAQPTFRRISGLSALEWRVLLWANELKPIGLSELVRLMERQKGQVGTVVKRLEHTGLVKRDLSRPKNIEIHLTPEGERIATRLDEETTQRDRFFLTPFVPVEQERLIALFDRLNDNAQNLLDYDRELLANI